MRTKKEEWRQLIRVERSELQVRSNLHKKMQHTKLTQISSSALAAGGGVWSADDDTLLSLMQEEEEMTEEDYGRGRLSISGRWRPPQNLGRGRPLLLGSMASDEQQDEAGGGQGGERL
jgi:hypothetical protein